jgi:quinolinate synthase
MKNNLVGETVAGKIMEIKKRMGKQLVILTHNYQRKEIVDLGDYCGDSFDLSQKAVSDNDARFIVFCGVHFMAESAAILAKQHQVVQIPDMDAGCWMADMANIYFVEKAWNEVIGITGDGSVTPLVYMNSDALIKAHCGKNDGAVCTSSNAPAAFRWAFEKREKIFFFPDEHLGRNTGNLLGIPPEQMIVWDPDKVLGGNSNDAIKNATLILWKGHCLVHTRFTVEHIVNKKSKFPDGIVVVHPECVQEVVGMADAVGSTNFIGKYVADAPSGATIIIGTEVNMIKRLAVEYPDKKIVSLYDSLCPNMFKINPANLLETLENIGKVNVVHVDETTKKWAKIALDNMLSLVLQSGLK